MQLLNIPNTLTIFRIIGALSLPMILLFESNDFVYLLALLVFIGCSITDFLDGYLARKLGKVSDLGKMLDPIADKILIILVLCFLTLAYRESYSYFLGIPSILIIVREILVSGIREYFGPASSGKFAVTKLSKFKTTIQMTAVILLLAGKLSIFSNYNLYEFGTIFLWISAGFALYTGLVYVYQAILLLGGMRE